MMEVEKNSKICPGPGCGYRIQKSEGFDYIRCKVIDEKPLG